MRPPFLALLVCFSASVTARAQDLGVVGLRTVTQPVYSAVSCAAGAPAAVLIDNRGQNVHTLLYQTSGPISALALELRGRNNAAQNWVRISSTATATGSGALVANVYLDFVQVFVTTCTGTGSLTATYSGSFVSSPPAFGIFGLGAENFERCTGQQRINFTAGGAGATRIVPSSASGQTILLCHFSVSVSAATNLTIQAGTGTNCGTGTINLAGPYQNVLTAVLDFGYWAALNATAVNQDVCVNVSGATTVGGVVIYAEL